MKDFFTDADCDIKEHIRYDKSCREVIGLSPEKANRLLRERSWIKRCDETGFTYRVLEEKSSDTAEDLLKKIIAEVDEFTDICRGSQLIERARTLLEKK